MTDLKLPPDLGDALTSAHADARAAWPALDLPLDAFLEHAAASLSRWSEDERGWLERFRADDFYLAIACLEHTPGAIVAFEDHFARDLTKLLTRFSNENAAPEDLRQLLFEKLFVGSHTRPARISEYGGQGYLQNWLRVTATRAFIDLGRTTSGVHTRADAFEEERTLQAAHIHFESLELAFLKREYRGAFKQAFEQAVSEISSRHRLLLRQHFVEAMTIDALGALYGVHRATAARWLVAARQELSDATRRIMTEQLTLKGRDFDSIYAMIQSRLDVSMHRLLSPAEEE